MKQRIIGISPCGKIGEQVHSAPIETTEKMPESRPIWEQYWILPDDVEGIMTMEQYDSVTWTNWPQFTVGLVQRGFSDNDIRKIIGGNVLRVFRDTLA